MKIRNPMFILLEMLMKLMTYAWRGMFRFLVETLKYLVILLRHLCIGYVKCVKWMLN